MRLLVVLAAAFVAFACSAPTDLGDAGSTGGGGGASGGGAASNGGGSGAGGGRGGGSATGGGADAGHPLDAGTVTTCTQDGDCASGLCQLYFPGAPKVCVTACAQQSDCTVPNTFCDPRRDAGGGLCVPRQPAHCLDCTMDSECGTLSEVCTPTATDPTHACHIDCSLAGAAACPPEYGCGPVMVNGVQRLLCSPTGTTCPNSTGGYCNAVVGPLPCFVFAPDAGTCSGVRYCDDGRYDLCAGPTPACRADCSAPSQTGCMEEPCPAAVTTPANCGSCGNACPGAGAGTADATCARGSCELTCKGENYDVNNQAADGCEIADAPTGNHVSATPTDLGSISCDDGNGHTVHHDGKLPSDTRVHANPQIAGFDATSGSAPDQLMVTGSGGTFCENDVNVTLTVTGSSAPACYRLHVVTTDVDMTCNTSASGSCNITAGSGSYNDGSELHFTVSKTCSAAMRDGPAYTVDGHI